MKLSTNFVKDYIDIPVDYKTLADDMTNVGNEYDSAEKLINATNLVIGEILECEMHPDSDHLHVCKVNVGSETLQIVCGAPNARVGIKVVVALVGAILPGDFKIKKGNGEKVIVSEGNYNSGAIALALSGLTFKSYKLLNTVDAFNEFLISKDATLIGTMRDVVRLSNKNIECEIEVLGNFNDLYQYALITSKNSVYYSRLFIDYLLSSKVQKTLTEISLLSVSERGLYPDIKAFATLEKTKTTYTVSPFLDVNTIEKLKELAKEVLNGVKEKEELIKHL